MTGFLLQWLTIPTLLMFPVLAAVYVRLAPKSGEIAATFGQNWIAYAYQTPGFIPSRRPRTQHPGPRTPAGIP